MVQRLRVTIDDSKLTKQFDELDRVGSSTSVTDLHIRGGDNNISGCLYSISGRDNHRFRIAKLPGLKTLTISGRPSHRWGCDVGATVQIFRSLPNLSDMPASKLQGDPGEFKIENLLEFLKSTPQLEEITIDNVVLRGRMPEEPAVPVTLGHLRKLKWVHCHVESISLLRCLICPNLTDLEVKIVFGPRPHQLHHNLSSILPNDAEHIPLPLKPRNAWCNYMPNSRAWCFAEDKTSLKIIVEVNDGTTYSTFNDWFLGSNFPIDLSNTQYMGVKADDGCPLLDDFPTQPFKNLRGLTLIGKIDSLAEIIRARHGGGELQIPFATLSKLRIFHEKGNRDFLSKLVTVLKGRRDESRKMEAVLFSELNHPTFAERELEAVMKEPIMDTNAGNKANDYLVMLNPDIPAVLLRLRNPPDNGKLCYYIVI